MKVVPSCHSSFSSLDFWVKIFGHLVFQNNLNISLPNHSVIIILLFELEEITGEKNVWKAFNFLAF